jgi:hypothetical protein
LQFEGPAVADGNMGKNLGQGLYEFRLDQDAEQILRRKGKSPKPEGTEAKILLRVFFHPHGDKLLLLSGYDKAERPSKGHQQGEIQKARAMLREWKERTKRVQSAGASSSSRRRTSRSAGIDQSDVSNVERGSGNPTLATLDAIAGAVGMEIEIRKKRAG